MTLDRRTGEVGLAVLWVVLGAGLIILTLDLREANANDPLGPAFLPRTIGAALIILGAWLAWRGVWRTTAEVTEGEAGLAEDDLGELVEDRPLRGVAAIAIVIGYLLIMPFVGYLPSTVVAGAALLWLQGVRSALVVVLPVALAVVLFAVFSTVLSVRFP